MAYAHAPMRAPTIEVQHFQAYRARSPLMARHIKVSSSAETRNPRV
jgi:hypothetical protein